MIGAAVLAVALTGCASANTGPDLKAVHYTGGQVSSKKFVDCLDPSTRSGFDPGDLYAAYPVRQVSYDATGGDGAEAEAPKVVSDDGAELFVPVTVTFNLTTDCKVLRKMHETVGTRFAAYTDANGESADMPKGWIRMLNFVIGKPLDSTLDRVAKDYRWRDIWNDPKVKAEMETAINNNIDDLVARQAGGQFFEDFSVLVQTPDPVDPNLKGAIAEEQSLVAKANAQKAQADADAATAEAQKRLAEAKAKNQQATIDGFRLRGMTPAQAMEAYLKSQAIANGQNPYQPTYRVSDTR